MLLCVFVCVGLSCQPLVRSEALEDPREPQVSLRAVQVVGQGTCHWELQGGVGASWEACHQEGGQQRADRTSCVPALAGLVPSAQSALGGEGPWGGDPLGDNQGALQLQEGVHRGVLGVLRGEEVLHGVVGVPQGACQEEGAQTGVQIQAPVPVLGPGLRRRLQQRPAAPSAASPSSLRI